MWLCTQTLHMVSCYYHLLHQHKWKNSFWCVVIISPKIVLGVSILSLLFFVAYQIPRYVQYMEILKPTTHTYPHDKATIIILSLYSHKYASKFLVLVIFDNHGKISEYLWSNGKLRRMFCHWKSLSKSRAYSQINYSAHPMIYVVNYGEFFIHHISVPSFLVHWFIWWIYFFQIHSTIGTQDNR